MGTVNAPLGLAASDTLAVVGVVDLAGDPTEVPTDDRGARAIPGEYARLPRLGTGPRRMRWPALVVADATATPATVEGPYGTDRGTDRRHDLWFISLRASDRGAVLFREPTMRVGPGGRGVTASYRLVREAKRGPLTIVATETRHAGRHTGCLPPPPTEHRFTWQQHRFERVADLAGATGCH